MKPSLLTLGFFVAGCAHSFHGPMSYDHSLGASQAVRSDITAAVPVTLPVASALDLTRGQALFETHCRGCHGQAALGDGRSGEPLNGIRPANLLASAMRRTDRELYALIAFGRGDMPTWNDTLAEQDVWHLVHFVRTLAQAASDQSQPLDGP